MKFVKYPSLTNHYETEKIERWIREFPELKNVPFHISEKIDGANVAFYFSADGKTMKIASRSGWIPEGDNFFGINKVLQEESFQQTIEDIKKYSNSINMFIVLYGEIFGNKVIKRIDYTDDVDILFFDINVGGKMIPAIELIDNKIFENVRNLGLLFYRSINDFYFKKTNLYDALNFQIPEISLYCSKESDPKRSFPEGIVIKPAEKDFVTKTGQRVAIKKKNEKFNEKNHAKKEKEPIDDETLRLKEKFKLYVNENRVLSAFSKKGVITEKKQIGDYVKAVLDDAKTDFVADEGGREYPKEIFNVGKIIVPILIKYMEK